MSRAVRVEAAAIAADKEIATYGAVTTGTEPRYQELLYGPSSDMPERTAAAALTASDALLHTDEAVERVARALYDLDYEDWNGTLTRIQDEYRNIARAAITALLGEEE